MRAGSDTDLASDRRREKPLVPGHVRRCAVPHIFTLHQDLVRAGIPRQDDHGRHLDFHSFRYFFCGQLARLLPMREVQVHMRHKTYKLTTDLYAKLGINDVADRIRTLPSLFPTSYNQPGRGDTDVFTDLEKTG